MQSILPFDPLARTLHRIVGFFVIACGWWLMGLSVATCVEMLGRKVFAFSLQGVDEIGSYTFAVVGAFGFSYALITRGHTRVDFLLSRFSGTQRGLLNFTAMITLAAMGLFFVYRALRSGHREHGARQHRGDSAGDAALDPAVDLALGLHRICSHGSHLGRICGRSADAWRHRRAQ